MRFYPQTHSLRRHFPDADDFDWLERLHHGIRKHGPVDSLLQRMPVLEPALAPMNPRYRNGHRGGIYTNCGRY